MTLNTLSTAKLKKLRTTIAYAHEKSGLYHKKYEHITNLDTFDDAGFLQLPFTTKKDLQEEGISGLTCIPMSQLAEVHYSSGSTSDPVASLWSYGDIARSSEQLSKTWALQGVDANTIFGMMVQYGLFSAGLINHYALQHLGAFIVPMSNAPIARKLALIEEFGVKTTAAVGSTYIQLINEYRRQGIDPRMSPLQKVICGGEPLTEERRRYIERNLGVEVFDQYGLCEIDTGLAGECHRHTGLHVVDDHVIVEILDPQTLQPVPDGTEGELVLTTLGREAMPLIRYRTGDITSVMAGGCACGSSSLRIAPIKRRLNKTIYYKGLKLEESDLVSLMHGFATAMVSEPWQIVFETREENKPWATIYVSDSLKASLSHGFENELIQRLGFQIDCMVMNQRDAIVFFDHKAHHVIDNQVATK
jgi:phenylacetate-CoA ligase